MVASINGTPKIEMEKVVELILYYLIATNGNYNINLDYDISISMMEALIWLFEI